MKIRLVLGAIPLLVYPVVALADIMSLAAAAEAGGSILLRIVAFGFQITSLFYPVVYLGALIVAVSLRKKESPAALTAATVPLWFLLLVGLLFVGWLLLEA